MDGFLIINKPAGITSFQVIRNIKSFFPEKVGHAGTLDPFATGLLIILFNASTKLMPFILDWEKEYTGTIRLGIRTDTYDITGKIIETRSLAKTDFKLLKDIARDFCGEILQIPPPFSALKYRGRKFYELSRAGEKVPERRRKVRVHSFIITGYDPPDLNFRAVVGKGTYLRSIADDFGQRLGTGACLLTLRRVRIGSFCLDEAIEAPANLGEFKKKLRPTSELIRDLPRIVTEECDLLLKGKRILNSRCFSSGQLVALTDDTGSFLAIGVVDGEWIKPKRIITA